MTTKIEEKDHCNINPEKDQCAIDSEEINSTTYLFIQRFNKSFVLQTAA